jgi:hypothetical protein
LKRGTPNHPKTLALAAALGIPQWGAVGILESVWHFGASYARRGDIGRHADVAIASGIGWQEDGARLVGALVETGWLDACSCHRLRIHDWPVHADRAVAKTQEVVRLGWLECYAPRQLTVAQDPGGPAGDGDGSGEGAVAEDDGGDSRGGLSSVGWLESCAPRQEPGGPAGDGDGSGGRVHACRTRAARVRPAGAGAGASADGETPHPSPPRRRGEPLRLAQLGRDRADAVQYWVRLGGHPTRQDRRAVWEALSAGRPLLQVLGSVAERVRDELVGAGRLRPTDPWPPPGLAPFDPQPQAPPPRASPGELEAAVAAWERVSEALRPRLSPEAWATWIRPCRGLHVVEGRLAVEVPDAQFLDWIGRNWSAELQWAAAESGLEGLDLVMAPPAAIAG